LASANGGCGQILELHRHSHDVVKTTKITVIVCTYNRCQSLAKALDSIIAQIVPEPIGWEILVVDNNSSDQTRDVVEDFCLRYPRRFRYLLERQQGKSYALNAGIREARGDILAFTDDDVTVEPTWLNSLTSALHGSEWAGVGGRVLPDRNFSSPRWIPRAGSPGAKALWPGSIREG